MTSKYYLENNTGADKRVMGVGMVKNGKRLPITEQQAESMRLSMPSSEGWTIDTYKSKTKKADNKTVETTKKLEDK